MLAIYRGMAGLPPAERPALRPFSMAEHRILVPLRCPEGPPEAFCARRARATTSWPLPSPRSVLHAHHVHIQVTRAPVCSKCIDTRTRTRKHVHLTYCTAEPQLWEETSMLAVARFHEGALFRFLSVGESFWEVAPDLAYTPAAEWALASWFPAELRGLFVEESEAQSYYPARQITILVEESKKLHSWRSPKSY